MMMLAALESQVNQFLACNCVAVLVVAARGEVDIVSHTFSCLSFAVILIFQIWKLLGPVSIGQAVASDIVRCVVRDPLWLCGSKSDPGNLGGLGY